MKILQVFLKDESGQTTTEYVLILAVIVTIFMQFRRSMVKTITKIFTQLDDKTNNLVCDGADC